MDYSLEKASGKSPRPYDETVEEALCFGWIDSKPRALDSDRSMIWFAPSKRSAEWSTLNKTRVARAIKLGQMTAAGLKKINAARRDGSWTSLDAVGAIVLPKDLLRALAKFPPAKKKFQNFPRSLKRNINRTSQDKKSAISGLRRRRVLLLLTKELFSGGRNRHRFNY